MVTAAVPDPSFLHALRYRRADTGTLYDCACGDFTEAAELTDEDHRRVYEAHAAHITAALASPAPATPGDA
jgi:hypothetical protein